MTANMKPEVSSADESPSRRGSLSPMLSVWLARTGPFLGLVLVIAVFAVLSDTPDQYLAARNFRIVASQTVIVALGAIGMTMIIISGGIDLSVGSAIALTGVVTALGIGAGWSPVAAVLTGVFTGGVIGLLNGLAITGLRVVPFIATLGMLGIARGAAKWLADLIRAIGPDHYPTLAEALPAYRRAI